MAVIEKKHLSSPSISQPVFQKLSFSEKCGYLKTAAAKEKMDLILADPDARRLTAALEPQEFFWMVKEIGETDALDLLRLASTDQCHFILDMELWEGWTFSEERACHWLAYFMEGGEQRIHELLKSVDYEFLQLFLSRELIVAGGIGDQGNDDEHLRDYDHSFDGTFMLKFRNPKHSQLIGSFISLMMRLDHSLYVALMEGVKGDVDLELEEECLRFRSGRLEDLGFPPLDEALSIYARLNPDSFELHGDKKLSPAGEGGTLMPMVVHDDSLFIRALAIADSPLIVQELNYLVNSALVAEGDAFREPESMVAVFERVCGYLNIALEKLAAGDEQKAAELLGAERLKRLFQLGYSMVMELKFAAQDAQSLDYAGGKLLAGLKAKRPRYYRGLDPDGIDGYRQFKETADIQRVAELLKQLKG